MTLQRVGFACKYMDLNQDQPAKLLKTIQQQYSEKTTTITWLQNQDKVKAEQKLWEIIHHNTQAIYNLIHYVGSLAPNLRMVRIGSDQLPGYTHPAIQYFWQQLEVQNFLEKKFKIAGDLAKQLDVRLSMHPSQFVALGSINDDIVERSLAEFEYHASMIRWMGYGQKFQDFKCNVHISGKRGPDGIKAVLKRLSPEARNTITIENDEMAWGLEDCLELSQDLAIVLDIHHHWIKAEEYITVNDGRIQQVIDSWRGVRPVLHYSVSPEDLLINHSKDIRPDIQTLISQGFNKSQLRRHSQMMWNHACNRWAKTFREHFDIMVEAKYKNLASIDFEQHAD